MQHVKSVKNILEKGHVYDYFFLSEKLSDN